jgi:hypothetical protein
VGNVNFNGVLLLSLSTFRKFSTVMLCYVESQNRQIMCEKNNCCRLHRMLPIVPQLPVVYLLVGNIGHGMDHISAEQTIKFPKNMIFLKTLSCLYYGTPTRSAISRGGGGVVVLYQTGRVCTSRPAKKSGRSVKRKKNSNADVMYIHVSMCVV